MTTPRMRTGLEEDDKIFECCNNNTKWAKCGKIGLVCVRVFPIFFVFALLILSIYFFSVRLCSTKRKIIIYFFYSILISIFIVNFLIYGDIPRVTQGALYICAYWCLFVIVLYSYARAAFGDPRSPEQYNIKITSNAAEEAAAFRSDQYEPIKSSEQIIYLPRSTARMCGLCNTPKPPRSHHCSTCKRCFLKMDHHCVWLDNCVGFGNYKYFYCLLFWATFMCGFVFGATLEVLIQQLVYDDLEGVSVVWLILTIFSFALGVSTLMLLGYHSYLISKGMTTIEHIELNEEEEDLKRRERFRIRRQQQQQLLLQKQQQEQQAADGLVRNDASSTTTLLDNVPITQTQPQTQLQTQDQTNPVLPTFVFQSYSEGIYKNWCNALGSNPLLWLIPVNLPVGNGIRFKMEEATINYRAQP